VQVQREVQVLDVRVSPERERDDEREQWEQDEHRFGAALRAAWPARSGSRSS
jgi:hypothetical protein